MEKLEVGTIVEYCYGRSNYKYEVIKNDIKGNRIDNFIFGRDDNGNVLHKQTGKFDYVLAEYNPQGEFVQNITCLEDDIKEKA